MLKNYIIAIAISFAVGLAVASGVWLYFFNDNNKQHKSDIAKRDAIISDFEKQVKGLNESVKLVKQSSERITNTSQGISDASQRLNAGLTECYDLVNRLEKSQSDIRQGLSSGVATK